MSEREQEKTPSTSVGTFLFFRDHSRDLVCNGVLLMGINAFTLQEGGPAWKDHCALRL